MQIANAVVIALLCCMAAQTASMKTGSTSTKRGQACEAWSRVVSSLDPVRRKTLDSAGVVWTGDLIISGAIVSDCTLRLHIGQYFTRLLEGQSSGLDRDRLFARSHSSDIARVLATIWPTMNRMAVGDGSFDEVRYAMLREPALRDTHWEMVIISILRTEDISAALTALIMDRPSQALTYALRRQLSAAIARGEVERQIYCLACLQRLGEPVVGALKTLREKRGLTKMQQFAVRNVLGRIERTGQAQFEDIADLEYDDEVP